MEVKMIGSIIEVLINRSSWFLELLLEHIRISVTAIAIAGTIGLLLGIWVAERSRLAPFVMSMTNVVYTIPAIALLGLLIPMLGIGNRTAVTALVIYALMPMVRNTYAGISSIDREIVEAARGMGSTRWQLLYRIKLPLAVTVILAGLRNMIVMTIAVAGIASFIGAGGLGVAIYRGITTNNAALTFAGSILIALLAFSCDLFLGRAEKYIKKKRKMN
jgi:osmoprotectant transport system permease protein